MIISRKLRKKLENNKYNAIAMYILENLNNLDTSEINYLDIAADDNTKISYITPARESFFTSFIPLWDMREEDEFFFVGNYRQYTIKSIYVINGYVNITYFYKNESRTKVYKYQKKSDENCIDTSKGFFIRNFRSRSAFMSRPNKVFKKVIPNYNDLFSTKQIDEFTTIFRPDNNLKDKGLKLKLVDDIKKYYHKDNYANSRGTLGDSCMRYDKCNNRFGIYSENNIKLLILVDKNDHIHGRALVWPNMSFEDSCNLNDDENYTFMDRIYTSEYEYEFYFKEYARKNNWAYKRNQSADDCLAVMLPPSYEDSVDRHMVYPLEKGEFEKYPYLDTLKYLDKSFSCLSNNRDSFLNAPYYLTNYEFGTLDGEPGPGDMVYSDRYDEEIEYEEAVYSLYYEAYIYTSRSVISFCGNTIEEDDCEFHCIDGEYYHIDDLAYSDITNDYIISEDAIEVTLPNGNCDIVHIDNTISADYYTLGYIYSGYPTVTLPNGEIVYEEDEDTALEHYGLIEVEEEV
jgi:hypothetical protein